jgi:hypothetical protein
MLTAVARALWLQVAALAKHPTLATTLGSLTEIIVTDYFVLLASGIRAGKERSE